MILKAIENMDVNHLKLLAVYSQIFYRRIDIMGRTISLMRKKTLLNNKRGWDIVLDGKKYGVIYGGETRKIIADEGSHTISVQANDKNVGKFDEVLIPQGNENFVLQASLGTTMVGNTIMNSIKLKQL